MPVVVNYPPPSSVVVNEVTGAVTVVQSGRPGAPGAGVASGGTTGQVLAKASNTNFDTTWVNQSGGGGGTDVVYVGANDFFASTGSPARQRTNLIVRLRFAKTAIQEAIASTMIPSDWQTWDLHAVFAGTTTETANAFINIGVAGPATVGANRTTIASLRPNQNQTYQVPMGVADDIVAFTHPDGPFPAATNYTYSFFFLRNATNALDTYLGDIDLLYFLLVKVT
jgi:hypothetical protein